MPRAPGNVSRMYYLFKLLSARLFAARDTYLVKLVPVRAKMAPADDKFVQTGCFSTPDQTTFRRLFPVRQLVSALVGYLGSFT